MEPITKSFSVKESVTTTYIRGIKKWIPLDVNAALLRTGDNKGHDCNL
jgi:hypothetical protein